MLSVHFSRFFFQINRRVQSVDFRRQKSGVIQDRRSEAKGEEKEEEGEEMSLCLYECLKAVGLQHHYASFTSVGIHRAAHLSVLTMEDYPILGICSMEDRTRLFHLVQMVKTLDLEYEDDDDYAPADNSSFTYNICGDPDEDEKCASVSKIKSTSFSKPPCVRRQLDFSDETIDHHPEGTVHVDTPHDRNNAPGQGKGSAIPVQLDTGCAICVCKGKNNHRPDVPLKHCTEPNIMEKYSMYDSHTKPKTRPATVASKWFSNKPVVHKDGKELSRREKLSIEMSSKDDTGHMDKPTHVYESNRTAGYNYGLPQSSPPAPNRKQPRGQRISVCVRKRPLTHTECRRGEADVVTTPSGECVIVHESKEAVDLSQYILQHRFYFDQVFGEESSNKEVYHSTAYPLVQHMLNGGKATCFAYGQTGAGKTHTMLGSPVSPGLYELAVRDIFAHLFSTHTLPTLLVYVSFFEIYCGQLYDLLDHRKRLFAREDGQKVVHIVGLRDVRVDSVSSLLKVISQGTEERTQGMSGVNPLSSRSHALLQIQLRDTNQQTAGRMWFVDLAGSERASDTKEPDRQSRMEGAEINQSLLALKECIRSLDQEQSHTPFRQSKLTQVLRDSFVGDSLTCMIANISPGHLATEHTLNTLRYADRVKELRGQGGVRGGRRGKTVPSPKRNLSNSSSSGGNSFSTRGKSPPKKPKLRGQREDFGTSTPSMRLATRGAILCSTPKNSRWGKETNGIGFEHITPVRGWLGIGDQREPAGEREGRSRERYGVTNSVGHSHGDQNIAAGLVLGQATDERFHLWEVQKKSGFSHREKESQQSTLKEIRRIEQRRQVESRKDTCGEVKRLGKRDLQKVTERDKERERHLRQYHQQLQQFMPSSASSSIHLVSPSTCLSSSSSNLASLSSSVSPSSSSPLQHSSRRSVSALICNSMEEVLDAYRARVEVRHDGKTRQSSFFPSGQICFQSETSPSYNRNKSGVDEEWRASQEGTEARLGQDRSKHERRKSFKATVEGEERVKTGEWKPAGIEGGVERRWEAATETERVDAMTGAMPADVEALVSYNSDSQERREVGEKGLDASEAADSYGLLFTHRTTDSNSPFNQTPVVSSHQQAPAERPLSPACGHTNALVIPSELSDQGVQPQLAAHTNKSDFLNAQTATLPLTTSITQNGCIIPAEPFNILPESPLYTSVNNHKEDRAKMSVLPQQTDSSLSSIMDPISISLLEVDQQVATASFLQHNTSISLLDNEGGEDDRKKVEKDCLTCAEKDVEFRLSFMELPRENVYNPTSDTITATNLTERRKGMCCASYDLSGIGMMKPPIPEVMMVALQDQEYNQKPQTMQILANKTPESLLKHSTCAYMAASFTDSISCPIQQTGNADSPSLHSLIMTNGATHMTPEYAHNAHNELAFSTSTSVLGQLNTVSKQCHLNHLCNSNISQQPDRPGESNSHASTSNEQITPITQLSTQEDLDHGQWRVVQAHWEQLEEMEALCRKEGMLLCQQPDMAFEEYVHKLEGIMKRKARSVYSMIAQLQSYLNNQSL